jgi:hypothetical protein
MSVTPILAGARRWILILFIVLPLSNLLRMYWSIRDWFYDSYLTKPHLHDQRVKEIQRRVERFRADGGPKAAGGRLLCTARPQWLRTTLRQMNYQSSKNAIPIGESLRRATLPPASARRLLSIQSTLLPVACRSQPCTTSWSWTSKL